MALITLIFVVDKSYNAVLGVLFSLLHELGHVSMLILKRSKLKEISFGLINIDILEEDFEVNNLVNEILVYLSGPLVNLFLSLVFMSIYIVNKANIFKVMFIQNLILGAINLLPIKSLDGGKILYVMLSEKIGINKTELIMNFISIIFLVPICILGILILIKSKYNFSLLILACYLISYILYK